MVQNEMIAACGLLCESCSIRRMPFDDKAAKTTIRWFREMNWLDENEGVEEAVAKEMYCKGCHGDRSIHWSPDCWILQCCVDEKGLEHCDECDDFPCDKLVDWSKQNDDYSAAFERLKELHSQQDAD
ncbi:MAG: DUF3795 domain-containing protein [Candidatus Thorarchaeota archaeon]|nr:DUF3795 domain-containing protein [Candidatus Thorarchaeota archaeon]